MTGVESRHFRRLVLWHKHMAYLEWRGLEPIMIKASVVTGRLGSHRRKIGRGQERSIGLVVVCAKPRCPLGVPAPIALSLLLSPALRLAPQLPKLLFVPQQSVSLIPNSLVSDSPRSYCNSCVCAITPQFAFCSVALDVHTGFLRAENLGDVPPPWSPRRRTINRSNRTPTRFKRLSWVMTQGNRANGPAWACVEQRKISTPSSPRSKATENHRETVVRFARSALEAFSVVLGRFASR